MASQPGTFNVQELSDAGLPLVSGRLYTYSYGTTTQKTAYTDAAGTIPHTYTADGSGGQYIALNARGELPAPLYLTTGSYDLSLKRADGSSVWTRRADGQAVGSDFSASSGASLVGFIASGTGAVARTLQDKDRDVVSVKDYGATGNGATDDTATVQAAITAVGAAGGGTVYFPPGNYKVSTLTMSVANVRLLGHGVASSITTSSATANVITVSANSCRIQSLQIAASVTRTAGYYVTFNGSSYSSISNCAMPSGFNGVGINGAACTGIRVTDIVMLGVVTSGSGVVVSGSGNASDVILRDLWITGASATPANQPLSAVTINNGGDVTLDHVSAVYGGTGLNVSPGAGQTVQYLTVKNCLFDSGGGAGISLSATGAGAAIQGVSISDSWISTNGANGVLATTSTGGVVQDVGVVNSILSNNTGYGLLINTTSVTNVRVNACRMSANTTAGFGTAASATRFQVHGCTLGACGQFAGNPYGIAIGNNCDNFEITDNDLSNNTSGAMFNPAGVTFVGTPGLSYFIARNLGIATATGTIATLTAAAVTTTVTHGLAATPRIQDISLTPRSGWGTSGSWWINNPTATTFDIVTNANPGAGVLVAWQGRIWGA